MVSDGRPDDQVWRTRALVPRQAMLTASAHLLGILPPEHTDVTFGSHTVILYHHRLAAP